MLQPKLQTFWFAILSKHRNLLVQVLTALMGASGAGESDSWLGVLAATLQAADLSLFAPVAC